MKDSSYKRAGNPENRNVEEAIDDDVDEVSAPLSETVCVFVEFRIC